MAPSRQQYRGHDRIGAYPGAEPVPVDADGVAYALVGGVWLPQPPPEPALESAPPAAAAPITPQRAPRSESPPHTPSPIRPPAAVDAVPALRHNLTLADLADPIDPDACPPGDPQRRNEPRIPPAEPPKSATAAVEDDLTGPTRLTADPSQWYLMWGLTGTEPKAASPPDPLETAAPTPPAVAPAQTAPETGTGLECAPPPATTTVASDGGPSWLTRPRAGWQLRASRRTRGPRDDPDTGV